MKHYGDITKINGASVETVDVITGGSPCQDLSVAGKRAGLAGARSGLYMEQIRIVKEMRENDRSSGRADVDIRPRFMVWENVCGAFSSNKGEDFRAVLEEAAKVSQGDAVIPEPPNGKWPSAGLIMGDRWSIAWRVHDAQFWGVPQRRKRVCMLCDFNGGSAGDILFECWRETENPETEQTEPNLREESGCEIQSVSESLSGHFESSGTAGKDAAGDAEPCAETTGGGVLSFQERAGKPGGGKGLLIAEERINTLNTQNNQSVCVKKCLNSWDVQSKHIQPADGIAEALYSGECRGGGGESYVLDEQPILLESNQNHATIQTDGVSTALPASMGMGGGYVPMVLNGQGGSVMSVSEDQMGALRVEEHGHQPIVYSIDQQGGKGNAAFAKDVNCTLAAESHGTPHAVCYGISSYDSNAMKSPNPNSGIYEADTARTLDLNGGSPTCNQGGMAVVAYRGDAITSPVNASNPQIGDPCHTLTDDDRNYVVCIEGNGTRESHKGDGFKESETMYTLNTVEQHAVAYGLDRASYNQGQNAKYDFAVEEEVAPTLVAKGPGGVLKL